MWSDMLYRLRAVFRRQSMESELNDELRFHLEHQIEKYTRAGISPDEAARRARLDLGGFQQMKEECRDARGISQLDLTIQDLRYALRSFTRNRSFTVVAVLTLALGIGANTAIFSVVNTVLLKPLPFHEPDRLMTIWERNTSLNTPRDPVAPPNFLDWQKAETGFQQIAGFRYGSFALTGVDEAEQVPALAVTENLFATLGVQPFLGRMFTVEEVEKKELVVLLTHSFWRRRFGENRAIVGQTIHLNNSNYAVLGVMPPGFEFPPNDDSIAVFTPMIFIPADMSRRSHSMRVIGRLKDGAGIDEARERLGTVARNIAAADPGSNPEVSIAGAQDELVEKVRLGLFVLLGTVGFVLLIACANVANLLLARGTSRGREIAIRTSLGAGGRRIARQFFTENLVLAVVGGGCGVVLAALTLRLLIRIAPPDLPQITDIGIDWTVLAFVTALSVFTSLLFGLVPTLELSRSNLSQTLKQRKGVGRSLLVGAEVAMSVVLLTGAGLMIRSFLNIQAVDYGFRSERTITAQVFLNSTRYPLDNSQFAPPKADGPRPALSKPAQFFVEVMERIKALPGVEVVGAISAMPLDEVGIDFDLPILVEGQPRPKAGSEPQADFRIATPDYFRAMGIRVVSGRPFNDFDGPENKSVAIVNDALARQIFGNADPVGSRLLLYGRPREIVGVVGSVRHRSFGVEPRPEMYVPSRQFMLPGMTIVLKSSVDPASLIESIKHATREVDPSQPVYRFRTLDDFVADSVAQPRFTTLLLAFFAGLALILAVIGIYGVISYSVVQRTREIGIRMALGSTRSEVLYMIVRQGFGLVMGGVIAGLLGSIALGTIVQGLLFGISATDPATYIAVSMVLIIVAAIATLIPARQAARVDPLIALRHD